MIGANRQILENFVFVFDSGKDNIRTFSQSDKIKQLVEIQRIVCLSKIAIFLFIVYNLNIEITPYIGLVSLESSFAYLGIIAFQIIKQSTLARIVVLENPTNNQIVSSYGVLCWHSE